MGGCNSLHRTSAATGSQEELLLAAGGSRLAKPKPKPLSQSRSTRVKVGSSSNSQHLSSICSQEKRRDETVSFGSVPTITEAQEALSALQRLFVPVTSADELELNRGKSMRQLHQPNLLQSQGLSKVFGAFQALVFNPYVQRMVVSLSSDKAVWDAIMKNEVVHEIQESIHAGNTKPQELERSQDVGTMILRWILETTKAKIMELIDKITNLVNEIFHSQEREKDMENFDSLMKYLHVMKENCLLELENKHFEDFCF